MGRNGHHAALGLTESKQTESLFRHRIVRRCPTFYGLSSFLGCRIVSKISFSLSTVIPFRCSTASGTSNPFYSYRRHSIGSSREAFLSGSTPKIRPTPATLALAVDCRKRSLELHGAKPLRAKDSFYGAAMKSNAAKSSSTVTTCGVKVNRLCLTEAT